MKNTKHNNLKMPTKITKPSRVEAAGNKPKIIEEYIGRVNSGTGEVSIAQMTSPQGWVEPAQTPEFNEYTLVLSGTLKITSDGEDMLISVGEAVITHKGEKVQYSTPFEGGARYIAICLPAFSPEIVHRDDG